MDMDTDKFKMPADIHLTKIYVHYQFC